MSCYPAGGKPLATHYCDHPVWPEKGIQTPKKLQRKQRNGLRASREDVMNDVVVSAPPSHVRLFSRVGDSVLDHRGMVGREVKVLGRKLMDDRVDLDNCCVNAMRYEGGRGGADPESSADVSMQ